MRRALFVGLLVASAASAQSAQAGTSPSVAPSPSAWPQNEGIYASPEKPVSLVLNPELCDGVQQPMRWREVSDPLRFASQPLTQLSSGGAQYAELRPFLDLRATFARVQLFFVGTSVPALGHLQLVPGTGWQLAGC